MNVKITYLLFFVLFILACKDESSGPDTSKVKITVQAIRYEELIFGIDTNNIPAALQTINAKHPQFTKDYLQNILGINPQPDSVAKYLKQFIRSYRSLYNDAKKIYSNFSEQEKEITTALKKVKYYYPDYALPANIITFMGPINSFGTIITQDGLGIGLQLYLGGQHPIYQSPEGQLLYPLYLSRRFQPAFIAVNCMKVIVDDLYPQQMGNGTLIENMVESGKRLYLLNAFLPSTPDSLKTGYAQKQMEWCKAYEKDIWSFFVQNDLLFNNDPTLMQDYLSEAPQTAALGSSSPGNIGQFPGWKIVQKWMSKNSKISLDMLMKTNPKKIFDEAKYKP